jgi:hypothetical protein
MSGLGIQKSAVVNQAVQVLGCLFFVLACVFLLPMYVAILQKAHSVSDDLYVLRFLVEMDG